MIIKKILAYDLFSGSTDTHWNVITKTTCKFFATSSKTWHSGRNIAPFRPHPED